MVRTLVSLRSWIEEESSSVVLRLSILPLRLSAYCLPDRLKISTN
jgi:hypothetical protein